VKLRARFLGSVPTAGRSSLGRRRMLRLILSLIWSSGKAANRLKPTSLGMTSSQVSFLLCSKAAKTCRSYLRKLGRLKEMKTMTAYLIAHVKVTDDGWVPAYAASVHDIVHKHGGKYLSRSGNVKTLEGKPLDTTLIALLQFPSAEAAEAFVTDPEYAPYAAARQRGSDSRFQLIDDTDLAGTIPYLPKG